MNLKVAKNSANIVKQILETSILCKKMSDKKNIAEMESLEGGPKSIVKEVTHKLSHILSEMQIKIKIMTKIVEGDEVIFPHRAYRSLVLHILIWSTNISSPQNSIFIDVNIDKIEDGAIIQNIQPVI